jgi:hypothetical protein
MVRSRKMTSSRKVHKSRKHRGGGIHYENTAKRREKTEENIKYLLIEFLD